MKILLLGRDGQLGTDLNEILLRELVPQAVELSSYGYEELDISDFERLQEVIQDEKPDLIINAAAYTHVDKAELEPEIAFAVNKKGPLYLASECRKAGIPLFHISTDYVFDGDRGSYKESDETKPVSYYGQTKLAAEKVIRNCGLNYIIARTQVLYGWGENIRNNLYQGVTLSHLRDTLLPKLLSGKIELKQAV